MKTREYLSAEQFNLLAEMPAKGRGVEGRLCSRQQAKTAATLARKGYAEQTRFSEQGQQMIAAYFVRTRSGTERLKAGPSAPPRRAA